MNQATIQMARVRNRSSVAGMKRILLVDDDTVIRELLCELVQEWSFSASTAANLQEARTAVVTEEPFSIIVSDYHLPDGNGLEFLDWLKQEMHIQVPFLLISGGMKPIPSTVDGYEFLAKPFQIEEFRSCLDGLTSWQCQTPAQEAMGSVYARYPAQKDR